MQLMTELIAVLTSLKYLVSFVGLINIENG